MGFQRHFVSYLVFHYFENNSKLGGWPKGEKSLPNNKKKDGNTNQDHYFIMWYCELVDSPRLAWYMIRINLTATLWLFQFQRFCRCQGATRYKMQDTCVTKVRNNKYLVSNTRFKRHKSVLQICQSLFNYKVQKAQKFTSN